MNVASVTGATIGVPYQLLSYSTSIGGSGYAAFQLATLPSRATGVLSNSGSLIDLTITGTDFLKWTGSGNLANGWDTSTQNWALNSSGSATAYIDNPGDGVVFDDSAPAGNTTVNLNSGNVHPSSVTFSNSANTYTLQGTDGIAGATSLVMNGSGLLIVANSNGYSGGTVLSSGTLQVGNGAANGTLAARSPTTPRWFTTAATRCLRSPTPSAAAGR